MRSMIDTARHLARVRLAPGEAIALIFVVCIVSWAALFHAVAWVLR